MKTSNINLDLLSAVPTDEQLDEWNSLSFEQQQETMHKTLEKARHSATHKVDPQQVIKQKMRERQNINAEAS